MKNLGIAAAGMLLAAGAVVADAPLTLTNATLYTANENTGAFSGGGWWNTTPGDGAWDVFFRVDGTFINPGVPLDFVLGPGIYEFEIRCSDNRGVSGMNLYFNGDNSVQVITVHAPAGAEADQFLVSQAGAPTYGYSNGFNSPAAGSATFFDAGSGNTVQVIGFSVRPGTAADGDLVGPAFGPNGAPDGIGTLTLRVIGPPCGDLDGDGDADFDDLGILLAAFGAGPEGDLDADADTDFDDLGIMLASFGETCG